MVYDKARELARDISQSPEYTEYKKLREAAAQAEQAQTVQKTEETDGAKTPENDKKG